MRVIAGTAKGYRLTVPRETTVRPATDLVRGAIFSMLAVLTADWSQVLDLFSGSGSLGIEALSRGAGWVDFVDRNPRCYAIIKKNLERTKLQARAHVYCCSVVKALSFLDKEYNIILVDPPYSDSSIDSLLTQLGNTNLVGKNTTVVVTHSHHRLLSSAYATISLVKERRHGDSYIAIYHKGGPF